MTPEIWAAIIGVAFATLAGLVGVIWGQHSGRIRSVERTLERQDDTDRNQATAITTLQERSNGITQRLSSIETKLDRALFGRSVSPPPENPGRYGGRGGGE